MRNLNKKILCSLYKKSTAFRSNGFVNIFGIRNRVSSYEATALSGSGSGFGFSKADFAKANKQAESEASPREANPGKLDMSINELVEEDNNKNIFEINKYEKPIFWNYPLDKGKLKSFVSWFLKENGEKKTLELLEQLKVLGFGYATEAGISLGIEDLKIPPQKSEMIARAQSMVSEFFFLHKKGKITNIEKTQGFIEIWNEVNESLKDEVVAYFQETDILNPVYMMAFSGARGNLSQVRQLVGMRGLMSDPQGKIIDFPILSNFREGLTLTEYLISTYGARKGIVDTALRTATAGYLTRRLVDVAQHVIVSKLDCGTQRGIFLFDMKDEGKTIYAFQNRLTGRVLAQDIYKTSSNGQKGQVVRLAYKNQEIDAKLAASISKVTKKALVRSPLTCENIKRVCQLCYGWSLATARLVSIGEAVGVIAGQSIGEPGTQLTMRTFHTGGVFAGSISEQINAPFSCIVEYTTPMAGSLIRLPRGTQGVEGSVGLAFLTKAKGTMLLKASHESNPGSADLALLSATPIPKLIPKSKEEQALTKLKTEPEGQMLNGNKVEKTTSSGIASLPQKKLPPVNSVQTYNLPAFTVLFARQGEWVPNKSLLAQVSAATTGQKNTQISEQTVYSTLEGQVLYSQLDLIEDIDEKYGERVSKSENWAKVWVLSAKIVQTPLLGFNAYIKTMNKKIKPSSLGLGQGQGQGLGLGEALTDSFAETQVKQAQAKQAQAFSEADAEGESEAIDGAIASSGSGSGPGLRPDPGPGPAEVIAKWKLKDKFQKNQIEQQIPNASIVAGAHVQDFISKNTVIQAIEWVNPVGSSLFFTQNKNLQKNTLPKKVSNTYSFKPKMQSISNILWRESFLNNEKQNTSLNSASLSPSAIAKPVSFNDSKSSVNALTSTLGFKIFSYGFAKPLQGRNETTSSLGGAITYGLGQGQGQGFSFAETQAQAQALTEKQALTDKPRPVTKLNTMPIQYSDLHRLPNSMNSETAFQNLSNDNLSLVNEVMRSNTQNKILLKKSENSSCQILHNYEVRAKFLGYPIIQQKPTFVQYFFNQSKFLSASILFKNTQVFLPILEPGTLKNWIFSYIDGIPSREVTALSEAEPVASLSSGSEESKNLASTSLSETALLLNMKSTKQVGKNKRKTLKNLFQTLEEFKPSVFNLTLKTKFLKKHTTNNVEPLILNNEIPFILNLKTLKFLQQKIRKEFLYKPSLDKKLNLELHFKKAFTMNYKKRTISNNKSQAFSYSQKNKNLGSAITSSGSGSGRSPGPDPDEAMATPSPLVCEAMATLSPSVCEAMATPTAKRDKPNLKTKSILKADHEGLSGNSETQDLFIKEPFLSFPTLKQYFSKLGYTGSVFISGIQTDKFYSFLPLQGDVFMSSNFRSLDRSMIDRGNSLNKETGFPLNQKLQNSLLRNTNDWQPKPNSGFGWYPGQTKIPSSFICFVNSSSTAFTFFQEIISHNLKNPKQGRIWQKKAVRILNLAQSQVFKKFKPNSLQPFPYLNIQNSQAYISLFSKKKSYKQVFGQGQGQGLLRLGEAPAQAQAQADTLKSNVNSNIYSYHLKKQSISTIQNVSQGKLEKLGKNRSNLNSFSSSKYGYYRKFRENSSDSFANQRALTTKKSRFEVIPVGISSFESTKPILNDQSLESLSHVPIFKRETTKMFNLKKLRIKKLKHLKILLADNQKNDVSFNEMFYLPQYTYLFNSWQNSSLLKLSDKRHKNFYIHNPNSQHTNQSFNKTLNTNPSFFLTNFQGSVKKFEFIKSFNTATGVADDEVISTLSEAKPLISLNAKQVTKAENSLSNSDNRANEGILTIHVKKKDKVMRNNSQQPGQVLSQKQPIKRNEKTNLFHSRFFMSIKKQERKTNHHKNFQMSKNSNSVNQYFITSDKFSETNIYNLKLKFLNYIRTKCAQGPDSFFKTEPLLSASLKAGDSASPSPSVIAKLRTKVFNGSVYTKKRKKTEIPLHLIFSKNQKMYWNYLPFLKNLTSYNLKENSTFDNFASSKFGGSTKEFAANNQNKISGSFQAEQLKQTTRIQVNFKPGWVYLSSNMGTKISTASKESQLISDFGIGLKELSNKNIFSKLGERRDDNTFKNSHSEMWVSQSQDKTDKTTLNQKRKKINHLGNTIIDDIHLDVQRVLLEPVVLSKENKKKIIYTKGKVFLTSKWFQNKNCRFLSSHDFLTLGIASSGSGLASQCPGPGPAEGESLANEEQSEKTRISKGRAPLNRSSQNCSKNNKNLKYSNSKGAFCLLRPFRSKSVSSPHEMKTRLCERMKTLKSGHSGFSYKMYKNYFSEELNAQELPLQFLSKSPKIDFELKESNVFQQSKVTRWLSFFKKLKNKKYKIKQVLKEKNILTLFNQIHFPLYFSNHGLNLAPFQVYYTQMNPEWEGYSFPSLSLNQEKNLLLLKSRKQKVQRVLIQHYLDCLIERNLTKISQHQLYFSSSERGLQNSTVGKVAISQDSEEKHELKTLQKMEHPQEILYATKKSFKTQNLKISSFYLPYLYSTPKFEFALKMHYSFFLNARLRGLGGWKQSVDLFRTLPYSDPYSSLNFVKTIQENFRFQRFFTKKGRKSLLSFQNLPISKNFMCSKNLYSDSHKQGVLGFTCFYSPYDGLVLKDYSPILSEQVSSSQVFLSPKVKALRSKPLLRQGQGQAQPNSLGSTDIEAQAEPRPKNEAEAKSKSGLGITTQADDMISNGIKNSKIETLDSSNKKKLTTEELKKRSITNLQKSYNIQLDSALLRERQGQKLILTKADLFVLNLPSLKNTSNLSKLGKTFGQGFSEAETKQAQADSFAETQTQDESRPNRDQNESINMSDQLLSNIQTFENFEEKQLFFNQQSTQEFLTESLKSHGKFQELEYEYFTKMNLESYKVSDFSTCYENKTYKLKEIEFGFTTSSLASPLEKVMASTSASPIGKSRERDHLNQTQGSMANTNRTEDRYKFRIGKFFHAGDSLYGNNCLPRAGQLIHLNSVKLTFRKADYFSLSPKAILHTYNDHPIEVNAPVMTLPFETLKTGDIVQGIPKVEQYLEARTTIQGRLFLNSLPMLLYAIFRRYLATLELEKAARQSFLKIQQILVDGVQRVYRSQGVGITDKHLEIIVRQMTCKVKIIYGGQTGFFPGELVDLDFVERVNQSLMVKVVYEPVVLGITRASLEVDSFLSAASFQQTTKVLTRAAIENKRDFLKGLKENLLVGNLLPAGTGYVVPISNTF